MVIVFLASTTVRLETSTKRGLESLKEHKRESFDEVISKLLALVPEGDEEGKYSDEFRAGLFDAKHGEYVSLGRLKKDLGL